MSENSFLFISFKNITEQRIYKPASENC